jgi:hypothetical protein
VFLEQRGLCLAEGLISTREANLVAVAALVDGGAMVLSRVRRSPDLACDAAAVAVGANTAAATRERKSFMALGLVSGSMWLGSSSAFCESSNEGPYSTLLRSSRSSLRFVTCDGCFRARLLLLPYTHRWPLWKSVTLRLLFH